MRLSYFSPNTDRGRALAEDITIYAETLGYTCQIYLSDQATQADFLLAVHTDRLVIADCTIPEDAESSSETIYPLLTAQVNMMRHVLAFSETELPLNITPIQSIRDFEGNALKARTWLKVHIRNFVSDMSPRMNDVETIDELFERREEMEKMWTTRFSEPQTVAKKRVMISYRNSHADEVQDFISKHRAEVEIKCLPPGSLCGDKEALTPMRRWMLVGLLEDHIREVDEVWIYLTPDYTRSWWTIAELVMLADLNYASNENKKRTLKVYDAVHGRFLENRETPSWVSLRIDLQQHEHLARLLSNSRPDTMGPECLAQIEQLKVLAENLRKVPGFVRKLMLKNLRKSLEASVPVTLSSEERKELVDRMMDMYSDPDKIEAYANDDVFSDKFWHEVSYQVADQTPAFDSNTSSIDVDKFMSVPMDELTGISDKEFNERAYKSEPITISSASGNHYYNVNIGKKRYLWLATRGGVPTQVGKNPKGLELFQSYDLTQII